MQVIDMVGMEATVITDMVLVINNNPIDKVRVINNHTINNSPMPNLRLILNHKHILNHKPILKRILKDKHILSRNRMTMLKPTLSHKLWNTAIHLFLKVVIAMASIHNSILKQTLHIKSLLHPTDYN